MKGRSFALAFGAMLAFGSGQALADDRLDKAKYHVQEAVTHAKLKDTGLLAYHADLALEKAEGLQKFKPDPHLAEAIVHIKAAIEEGHSDHLAPAAEHVKAAASELDKVAQ
ncbi:small metal-binding protein SmbP [Methylosinus sp. Sm6]|uniref:small metal-binding protein SmbP n=1 Tax=Methylosinus sp. Sm6 TaxID=2866948 RepID=UPI001C998C7F|nr:small metal-binding protein SmbP [Methylosinus sp. Sm6]MBY6240637.1 hypothetical protein [Methylosinus sp. Sm6]